MALHIYFSTPSSFGSVELPNVYAESGSPARELIMWSRVPKEGKVSADPLCERVASHSSHAIEPGIECEVCSLGGLPRRGIAGADSCGELRRALNSARTRFW